LVGLTEVAGSVAYWLGEISDKTCRNSIGASAPMTGPQKTWPKTNKPGGMGENIIHAQQSQSLLRGQISP